MPSEYSLLQRLADTQGQSRYTTRFDEQKLFDSVLSHVQDMLNTRQGSVMALEDYGMPDFNDLVSQFPDAILRIKNAIKEFLERYEPRIHCANVYYVADENQPLVLTFTISAELVVQGKKSKVSFDTVLTGTGQAMVKR